MTLYASELKTKLEIIWLLALVNDGSVLIASGIVAEDTSWSALLEQLAISQVEYKK